MWLRRCGVAPFWPSRVKVVFQAALVAMFVYSVFAYLTSATIAMLDLTNPEFERAKWVLTTEDCRNESDPVDCTYDQGKNTFFQNYLDTKLAEKCPVEPDEEDREKCTEAAVPMKGVRQGLRTLAGFWSPFAVWRIMFLILMILLTVSVVVHDVSIMTEFGRKRVSSLHMLAEHRYYQGLLIPFWCCPPCMRATRARSVLCYALFLPFQILFQLFAFLIWVYPATLLMWFLHPLRLSRLFVCYTAALLLLWSIAYLLFLLIFDFNNYAVIVESQVFFGDDALKYPFAAQYPYTGLATGCVNVCQFRVSSTVLLTLTFAAITVLIQAYALMFRAFKGLRRQEWASLFSVLYTVPIEAFPVMWTRPDGSAIKWRTGPENPSLVAVQGEPAFDPFALMDEQPESARCRPLLMPIPRAHTRGYTVKEDAQIGCCGFPALEKDSDTEKGSDEEEDPEGFFHENHLPVIVEDAKPLFHHRLPKIGSKEMDDDAMEPDGTRRYSDLDDL
mmetsp:Transcript_68888/g.165356  ORF Transcript_68888/g.165356 Transcript_68888/m.165356 type:complete len:502 (-) Transcript_68888:91-1596(-)